MHCVGIICVLFDLVRGPPAVIKSFGVGWSLHWGWISLTRWCRELERWAGGPARGRICQRFVNFAEWHNMTFKFIEASAFGWSSCVLMIDLEVKHSKSPKHIMCSQCLDPRSSLILENLHLGFLQTPMILGTRWPMFHPKPKWCFQSGNTFRNKIPRFPESSRLFRVQLRAATSALIHLDPLARSRRPISLQHQRGAAMIFLLLTILHLAYGTNVTCQGSSCTAGMAYLQLLLGERELGSCFCRV